MPISYALTYPDRHEFDFPRIDLVKIGKFDFYEPDLNRYPCLKLGYNALDAGGNAPAVLNAANEICVAAFLDGKIKFTDISVIIERILENFEHISVPSLNDIVDSDSEARERTLVFIKKI